MMNGWRSFFVAGVLLVVVFGPSAAFAQAITDVVRPGHRKPARLARSFSPEPLDVRLLSLRRLEVVRRNEDGRSGASLAVPMRCERTESAPIDSRASEACWMRAAWGRRSAPGTNPVSARWVESTD